MQVKFKVFSTSRCLLVFAPARNNRGKIVSSFLTAEQKVKHSIIWRWQLSQIQIFGHFCSFSSRHCYTWSPWRSFSAEHHSVWACSSLIDQHRASLLYNNSGKMTPQTHSTHYKNRPGPGSGVTFSWVPFSLTWVSWLWTAVSAKTQPLLFSSRGCPPSSLWSQPPSPPSLPQCRLGREEQAETPHWPRWLAANQLQPKVIGSRWETFWWREQREQVASWKEEGGECKTRGEWKRDSRA